MKLIGIDIGSRSVKTAVYDGHAISSKHINDTPEFYRQLSCDGMNIEKLLYDIAGVESADRIICTGYGKNNINIEGTQKIVELKAHVAGAVYQTGLLNFTLIDAGGQDFKIILVRSGKMKDMLLNDKCAASCGRYIENMASVLGVSIDEIGQYYQEPVILNSTCAVFGESELIGRISEGISTEKLCAGVNYSLFKRIKPLASRFVSDTLVITGGVAKNNAFVHFAKTHLDYSKVIVPADPQFNGAIGCCVSVVER